MQAQTKSFLDALFGDIPEGAQILVWSKQGNAKKSPSQSRWASNSDEALRAVIAAQGEPGWHIYVGVCTGPKRYGSKRIPMGEVRSLPGLWLDFDIEGPGHKERNRLPKTLDEAMALIAKVPARPTMIVFTGGGIHAYWLFNEPLVFNTPEERHKAQELAEAWQRMFILHATAAGYTIDSTYDFARVLRVPGTFNYKTDPPIECRLTEENSYRYEPDDLKDLIPPAAFQNAAAKTVLADEEAGTFVLDESAQVPVEKFNALAAAEPRFWASWNRKRTDLRDDSASGYDGSLATFAAKADWSNQEIVNLIIAHRRQFKDDLKLWHPKYYSKTITFARTAAARTRAVEELTVDSVRQATDEIKPPLTESARDKALTLISDALGCRIKRVLRYKQDPPTYQIVTLRGEIELGAVAMLIKQESLRNAIAATDGHYIQKFSSKEWDAIAQSLLDACETVDVGPEATDIGAITEWLNVYLDEHPACEISQIGIANQTPLWKPDDPNHVYIFLSHFRTWLFTRQGEKPSARQLGVMLRKANSTSIVIAHTPTQEEAAAEGVEIKPTSRNVWKVPSGRRFVRRNAKANGQNGQQHDNGSGSKNIRSA